MASLSSNTDGEITEFKGRLGRAGFTAEIIRQVNTGDDNELAKLMYEALMRHPRFALVHSVFSKQSDVLTAFKARCVAKGIDFEKFMWIGSEAAPDFDPNDPETVVVLDATLDTLQNTFEFAWAWAVDGQDNAWRDERIFSDAKKLRLLTDDRKNDAEGDGPEFKPYTLRWVQIKLDTNIDKDPISVHELNSPGCALLFMCAEHPVRIKAIDHKKRFGFWLHGLKCTGITGAPWQGGLYVSVNRNDRQVRLNFDWRSGWGDHSEVIRTIPSFRK